MGEVRARQMISDLRVNPLLREVEEGQVGVWASWKQMDVSSLASFPGEVSMWSGFSLEILAERPHPADAD